MKKTKMEKGITLIALIITIVVLLILAVVAINAITKDDILGKAENATKKYNQSVENEKGTLNYYEAYLAGTIGKWVQDKTTVSKITPDGTITLNVGQTVTGYSVPEGIEDPGWAVLGTENGRLLLISKINVSELAVGSAGVGYSYVKDALEENAVKFKGELAYNTRRVKAEDINRITGYVAEKDEINLSYYDYQFKDYLDEKSDAYKLLSGAMFWTGEMFHGSPGSSTHVGVFKVYGFGITGHVFERIWSTIWGDG